MRHTTIFRPRRYLQLFEIDDGLVNPSPAIVSAPHAPPHDCAIDRTPRNHQVPNVPDASPGGTEAGIILIFKIVQHETTLVKFIVWMERGRCMWPRPLIASELERLGHATELILSRAKCPATKPRR